MGVSGRVDRTRHDGNFFVETEARVSFALLEAFDFCVGGGGGETRSAMAFLALACFLRAACHCPRFL